MAQAPIRKRATVRIKKGERVILPSDAKVISVTEVDGALATSQCDLPTPIPTKKLTYFFERRLDYNPIGSGNDLTVWIDSFYYGDNRTFFPCGIQQDQPLFNNNCFLAGLYSVPGIIKVYICIDCAGSGCNNTVTLEIPDNNTPPPYFVFNFDEGSAEPWFVRVYPVDPNQPGQVERPECSTFRERP